MIRRTALWDRADKAMLVFEALRNKYRGVTDDGLSAAIGARLDNLALGGDLPPPIAQDIASQIRTLEATEADAAVGRPDLVCWLQAQLLGRPLTDADYRTDSFVDDFDGEPPVRVEAISAALHELELLCSWAIPEARLSPLSAKAALLAHIFSSVIRIHPFKDANGRTARFLVQYALRSWDMALLPIPKVRNDRAWQAALGNAVADDLQPLTAEFLRRLVEPPAIS